MAETGWASSTSLTISETGWASSTSLAPEAALDGAGADGGAGNSLWKMSESCRAPAGALLSPPRTFSASDTDDPGAAPEAGLLMSLTGMASTTDDIPLGAGGSAASTCEPGPAAGGASATGSSIDMFGTFMTGASARSSSRGASMVGDEDRR